MGVFKLAAMKILQQAKRPLHLKDITKLALEQGLVETTGVTPERTMSTEIRRDIQTKGDKSVFVLVSEATVALNPKFTEHERKEEEKQELTKQTDLEEEIISRQYIGKAGEHLVQSELLFRGYNASIMTVDEGLDIVATKGDRLYKVQVKTSHEQIKRHVLFITVSSFKKHESSNTFYTFVLRGSENHTLVLPYHVIKKHIDEGDIVTDRQNKYRVEISIDEQRYLLGKKRQDVSYYIDKWDLMK